MKVEQILLSEFIFCQLPRKQKDLQKFNFIIRDNKSILYIQFVKRKQGALVPARFPYLPSPFFRKQPKSTMADPDTLIKAKVHYFAREKYFHSMQVLIL